MKRVSGQSLAIVLGFLFLASCNGSSGGVGPLPGPSTPPSFMRMLDAQHSSCKIFIIAPPFAAPLTPAGSFSEPCDGRSLAINTANGMLAQASGSASVPSVTIYNPPYSSSTAATVTISGGTSTLVNPRQVAWDPAGNVWVADRANGTVDKFAPPFAASSAPAATNTFANEPVGLAFNPVSNLMFVGDENFGCPCNVFVFPAPYTGVPIATLSTDTSHPTALAVDFLGRLFVGFSTGPLRGKVEVFTPPFATGNTPVFTLKTYTTISAKSVENLAFDSAWNLYVQQGNGTVVMFTGPILGSSNAPSAVLGCPAATCNDFAGIAFGP